ncbi:hypothetical protein [Mesorhizobium sp. STM 4661]|uniref:hypothetical protein n=1 Tax=Mesorhizobium sp. STM 4661 TaxID=1297570 RepID=UPI0012F86B04|nr:hypothetical protein [Mesorhizobium sp. STM 4661]
MKQQLIERCSHFVPTGVKAVTYFRPTNLDTPDPWLWFDRLVPLFIIALAVLILAWSFA